MQGSIRAMVDVMRGRRRVVQWFAWGRKRRDVC